MHPLFVPIIATVGPLNFETEGLSKRFKRRELKRNEHWLRPGETCRKIAFVESGSLRQYREYEEQNLTRWAAFAGSFTTSMTSFTQGRASEDGIVATEATILWELGREAWQEMRTEYPQLQAFWVATLVAE